MTSRSHEHRNDCLLPVSRVRVPAATGFSTKASGRTGVWALWPAAANSPQASARAAGCAWRSPASMAARCALQYGCCSLGDAATILYHKHIRPYVRVSIISQLNTHVSGVMADGTWIHTPELFAEQDLFKCLRWNGDRLLSTGSDCYLTIYPFVVNPLLY